MCVAGCAAVGLLQSDWPESSVLLNVEKLQRRRQKRRCLRLSSHPSDSFFRVLLHHRLLSHFFFSSSRSDLVCWVPAPATASWVLKTVSRRRRPLRWMPESSSDTSLPRASRPGSCSRWQSTEGELSHSFTHSLSHLLTPPESWAHSQLQRLACCRRWFLNER